MVITQFSFTFLPIFLSFFLSPPLYLLTLLVQTTRCLYYEQSQRVCLLPTPFLQRHLPHCQYRYCRHSLQCSHYDRDDRATSQGHSRTLELLPPYDFREPREGCIAHELSHSLSHSSNCGIPCCVVIYRFVIPSSLSFSSRIPLSTPPCTISGRS